MELTAMRQGADAKALQAILQLGEEQLAQVKVKVKVKPVAEVVKRLRRVKGCAISQ